VAWWSSVLLCQLVTATAQAATPLPYAEVLGDLVNTECDVRWAGGICEAGWKGTGSEGSVQMVSALTSSFLQGIKIKPGTNSWNGVARSFDLSEGDLLEWTLPVVPVDGTVEIGIRVEFKSWLGGTLEVQEHIASVTDTTELTARFLAPRNTSSALVVLGARSGSTGSARAVLVEADCLPGASPADCSGWGGRIVAQSGECPPCAMLCPPGALRHECEPQPEAGALFGQCTCETRDPLHLPDTLQSGASWR
jgi:hypothetical protein